MTVEVAGSGRVTRDGTALETGVSGARVRAAGTGTAALAGTAGRTTDGVTGGCTARTGAAVTAGLTIGATRDGRDSGEGRISGRMVAATEGTVAGTVLTAGAVAVEAIVAGTLTAEETSGLLGTTLLATAAAGIWRPERPRWSAAPETTGLDGMHVAAV
jgi:hypothetical protein